MLFRVKRCGSRHKSFAARPLVNALRMVNADTLLEVTPVTVAVRRAGGATRCSFLSNSESE
jgi:hypothetical protein